MRSNQLRRSSRKSNVSVRDPITDLNLMNLSSLLTIIRTSLLLWLGAIAVCEASEPTCSPAPPGLAVWLPLNGDGNDVISTNDGVVSGSPVFGAGHVGGALA